jgi:hypothetical protein
LQGGWFQKTFRVFIRLINFLAEKVIFTVMTS